MKQGRLPICSGTCRVLLPLSIKEGQLLGQEELRSCRCLHSSPPEAGLAQTSPGAELRLEQRKQRLGRAATGRGWGCSPRALRPQDPQSTDIHASQGLSSRNNRQLSVLKQNNKTLPSDLSLKLSKPALLIFLPRTCCFFIEDKVTLVP